METKTEDFRTDQEKRQDAFDAFAKNGIVGTIARIIFAGDKYKVKLVGRRQQDGMNLVKFEIQGNRHTMDGDNLEFNLGVENDSELIKIIK